MAEVLTVANMKGGVGKTTLCVNLAFDLFARGNRVLLVDNDPQFNATTFLMSPTNYLQKVIGNPSRKTIVDVYERLPRVGKTSRKELDASEVIEQLYYIANTPNVFEIIPSKLELYETLDNASQRELKLDRFLRKLHDKYDFILIDCPPTPSILTRAAFAASKHVIVPVTPDHFATLGLPQFLATLRNFKDELTDEYDVAVSGVVLTRVPSASSAPVTHAISDVRAATEEYGLPLFTSRLPEMAIFKRAIWKSKPVHALTGYGTSTRGKAKEAIRAIADELLAKLES